MISRFFIDRPVFAGVLSIVIVIAGLAAMSGLPIAQFPEITPPLLQITASYPGADAETASGTVAAPIEQQVNGVDNMIYMQSNNSNSGDTGLNVYFDIGTDVDRVLTDLTNRANLANPQLPQDVTRNGVVIKKSSPNILMAITILSDGSRDPNEVANYTSINIVDELKRIPGANQVSMFGLTDYAMRIWLRPDRMAELGITTADVRKAIQEQNTQPAAGRIGQEPTAGPVQLSFPVTARGRLSTPEEFDDIMVRSNPDGSSIRIRDIARSELGIRSYDVSSQLNGKDATVILVYQQPGANALTVATDIRAALDRLSKNFPSGVSYVVPYDTTKFVEVSIEAVIHTFFEAVVLVVVVVFLFLQNWRATVIPLLAVPVSIIGTFAGMYALDFSINTLTLFGMILAIGIVVDDAIVVVESVEHNMAQGMSPKEAARRTMDEVSGPVVAIVLVLCAVFVPVGFLGGITGQLYKQFAITIAISVVISGIVALTLSPALAAVLLKPSHGEKNIFFRGFEAGFHKITGGYLLGATFLIKRALLGTVLFAGVLAIAYGLFRTVPTSFVPDEDQGYLIVAAFLPDGASLERTREVAEQIAKEAQQNPAVENVLALGGFNMLDSQNKPNAATVFVPLKDWKERKDPAQYADAVRKQLQQKFAASIGDAMVLVFNPPPIPGLGTTGGFEFWVQNRGEGGTAALEKAVHELIAKSREEPALAGLSTLIRANSQQLFVDLDRDRARSLGVQVTDVFDLLQGLFGTVYVNDFNKFGRTYRVILQAEPDYRTRPEDINKVYVRASSGQMVPLSALVQLRYTTGPDNVARFNGFVAARINGGPAPGYSSGQALAAMEKLAREHLPPNMYFEWAGQAFQEKKAGSSSALAFGFGLVMVFLILAAQYEKWTLPLSVLVAVPFGVCGALIAVFARGLNNDVYFQIGLVTLIGLAAKNAILIVEFAVEYRHAGRSAMDAALEAARLRFRPIVMTSLAFILGCVPLAISSGAGANSRISIGTGVIGGMLGATVLAIFFVPLFYRLFDRGESQGHGHAEAPSGVVPDVHALPPDPSAPLPPAPEGDRHA